MAADPCSCGHENREHGLMACNPAVGGLRLCAECPCTATWTPEGALAEVLLRSSECTVEEREIWEAAMTMLHVVWRHVGPNTETARSTGLAMFDVVMATRPKARPEG